MLGRLFKLTSTQNLKHPPPSTGGGGAASSKSFDDSYTRSMLYGLTEMSVAPGHLLPRRFRLVVAQDGGALAEKQVLFDLFGDTAPPSPQEGLSPPVLDGPDLPALHHKLAQVSLGRNADLRTGSLTGAGSSVASGAGSVNELTLSSPEPGDVVRQHAGPPSVSIVAGTSSAPGRSPALSRTGMKRNVVLRKQSHEINVLAEYMFGRGLPSNECHMATKIHILPPLNLVHGTSRAVLVTRLFLLVDTHVAQVSDAEKGDSACWNPQPTIHTRGSTFSYSSRSLQVRMSLSSRFAIGIVVPFDDPSQTVEETLLSNWDVISMQLVQIQKAVATKLAAALKNGAPHSSPYICNKRALFPPHMLQGDVDLVAHLQRLIRIVHYLTNVPRLISTHSLMMHTFSRAGSPFKNNTINWALEVINWLEFKDGKYSAAVAAVGPSHLSTNLAGSLGAYSMHSSSLGFRASDAQHPGNFSTTFLANLFAVILSLRTSLAASSVAKHDPSGTKEITRVVVMTSNSSVAKKLVFLVCGLIPNCNLLQHLYASDSTGGGAGTGIGTGEGTRIETNLTATSSTGPEKPAVRPHTHASPCTDTVSSVILGASFASPLEQVRPIPIRRQQLYDNEGPSDESVCALVSSTKGWEVPVKATTNLSCATNINHATHTSGATTAGGASKSGASCAVASRSVAVAQKIPHLEKDSCTLSVAYLSSSLNSSLSSSASNYSFLKLGSSFMDKWKNSLVGAHAHAAYHFAESFDPPVSFDAARHTANKSPSPACDDNAWDAAPAAPSPPSKHRCSRTRAVYNMYSERNASHSNIERTPHAMYVPMMVAQGGSVLARNEMAVRLRVSHIFAGTIIAQRQNLSLLLSNTASGFAGGEISEERASEAGGEISRTPELQDARRLPRAETRPARLQRRLVLQPHVAFVDEYRPECVVQSCPVNPNLEAQVISSMKNDLAFYQGCCGYKKVVSQTVFVCLRARDIKLIEVRAGGSERGGNSFFSPSSPENLATPAHLPLSTCFSSTDPAPGERRTTPAAGHKTTVRKVFSPGRVSFDRDILGHVEAGLARLTDVVSVMNSEPVATSAAKQELSKMLSDAVRALIT